MRTLAYCPGSQGFSMADDFTDWYVHTVDVDTPGTPDEWGATSVTTHSGVACWIEDKIQLVTSSDGSETVSTSTVWTALGNRAWFPPGASVTLQGRVSNVISVTTGDSTTGDSLDGIGVTVA